MQPQPLEGVGQHQRRRLRAQAAAPRVALADRDVEQHRAVVAIERREGREADLAPAPAARRSSRPARRRASIRTWKKRSISALASSGASGSASAARSPGRGTSGRRCARSSGRGRRRATRLPDDLRRMPQVAIGVVGHVLHPDRDQRPRSYTTGYHRRMRRWSETAARIAATTRTTEKVATLAEYLRTLTPDELPLAVTLHDRPAVPGARPAHDGHRLGGDRGCRPGACRRAAGRARRGVQRVVRPGPGGRRPARVARARAQRRSRRRCSTSTPRSAAIAAARGAAAKGAVLRELLERCDALTRQVRRQDPVRRAAHRPARGSPRGGHRRGLRPSRWRTCSGPGCSPATSAGPPSWPATTRSARPSCRCSGR